MRDLWSFLLQTLTASGAAALLLVVKAMFRDKLSPRWQCAVWGLLLGVLLAPAGTGGRYALVNWPWLVETAKTAFSGDCATLTHVTAPIPLPAAAAPESAADWLFLGYLAGVVLLLGRYAVSYVRLRRALRRGTPAGAEQSARVLETAGRYGLPVCPAVEVPGLRSAFVCGVFHPVLALPAGKAVDEKVVLHELLHLKYHDAAWGLVICFFRCIHWCNPLLWVCADRAGNDLEALCDQRVLERLEGEERRDYGRILLSMADEQYARAPGTSSMANGGKNIRRRIESIARFKRYPKGMALVSVCVAVTLAAPLLFGVQARSVYDGGKFPQETVDFAAALASARTTPCTTPAGALDTYAKAVLDRNGIYRAMCAPLEEQAALAAELRTLSAQYGRGNKEWTGGLPCWPDEQAGYAIYNLESRGEDACEGLLAVALNYPPDGRPAEPGRMYLGVQRVRTERREDRWVVLPLEAFWTADVDGGPLGWGFRELPAYVYEAETGDFRVSVQYQTSYRVDNTVETSGEMDWAFGPSSRFDDVPKPNAEFDDVDWSQQLTCTYIGSEEGKADIRHVGASTMDMDPAGERPELRAPGMQDASGSSSDGSSWGAHSVGGDWGPTVYMGGGGSSRPFREMGFDLPEAFAADLYVNGKKAAELTLLPVEGGAR